MGHLLTLLKNRIKNSNADLCSYFIKKYKIVLISAMAKAINIRGAYIIFPIRLFTAWRGSAVLDFPSIVLVKSE